MRMCVNRIVYLLEMLYIRHEYYIILCNIFLLSAVKLYEFGIHNILAIKHILSIEYCFFSN